MVDQPKLTESELAALDYLIAELKESKGAAIMPAGVTAVAKEVAKALAKEGAFEAVREVVREAVEKVMGGASLQTFSVGAERDVAKRIADLLREQPTLDQLIAARRRLGSK